MVLGCRREPTAFLYQHIAVSKQRERNFDTEFTRNILQKLRQQRFATLFTLPSYFCQASLTLLLRKVGRACQGSPQLTDSAPLRPGSGRGPKRTPRPSEPRKAHANSPRR